MPTITLTISQDRGAAVLDAVLVVHPKPLEGEPGYVDGETDPQWMQRALVRRFRRTIVAIMKKADTGPEPDPGISED